MSQKPSVAQLWLGLIVVSWLVDLLIPLPFLPLRFSPIASGGIFVFIGFGIVALALHELRDFNAPDETTGTSIPTLVTGGVYRLSRNPICIGLHIALAGVAIAADSLWILAMIVPFHLILARRFIPNEEAELERIYGDLYREYSSHVRRWL